MRTRSKRVLCVIGFCILAGCVGAKFASVPEGLDRSKVTRQTVRVTARDFSFEPSIVRVKAGTLLRLEVKSMDGTHGFRLGDFGIDERLNENEEKAFEVYIPAQGEYSFRCSHFCGLGHFGMSGTIVAE